MRAILEQTPLPRLRLSSIEPMDWDDELIGLMRDFGGSRLARHAHLPLQSGSDAVLRRMHRRYRPWHYAEKVAALLRAAGPDLTLGADVMVGFPGETEREFEETLAFIRALPFGYLHLFPFSPRPGTRAWALHAAVAGPAGGRRGAHGRAARPRSRKEPAPTAARFIGSDLSAITLHTPAVLAVAGPHRSAHGKLSSRGTRWPFARQPVVAGAGDGAERRGSAGRLRGNAVPDSVLRDGNVRLSEICSFEEQFFAGFFGQSVGHAIAEIELGGMAAFAVLPKALAGQSRLHLGKRGDLHQTMGQKQVQVPQALFP